MADQTLAVFEPPQPNSGVPGGKFLEVRAAEGGWRGGLSGTLGGMPWWRDRLRTVPPSDWHVGSKRRPPLVQRGRVYKPGNKVVSCSTWLGPRFACGPEVEGWIDARPAPPHPELALPKPTLQAWLTEDDLAVGALLDLHGRRFRLTRADAYTERYMAERAQQT